MSDALAIAGDYLVAQQKPDGSWRSELYAHFRDGYSLTPLVLAALRFVPPSPARHAAYRRGVEFVAGMVGPGGTVTGRLDYPLYSLAIAILVLNVPDNRQHLAARDALLALLRDRQLDERRGVAPGDPSRGGWGYILDADTVGPANISATVFAIGAMRLAGVPTTDPALIAARQFVERCQNLAGDGGFFFSPGDSDANKAGEAAVSGELVSYGTATADGLRALLQLGEDPASPRATAATRWLLDHFQAHQNPGAFPEVAEVRRVSSTYYWSWTGAHVMRAIGGPALARRYNALAWPEALATSLLAQQREDGSFANVASELREDDPLVATAFAVAALAVSQSVIDGQYRSHASASPGAATPGATP